MTGIPPARLDVWSRRIAWLGVALCLPLLLMDWVVHRDPDYHPHFACERWFGFYSGLSLISCLALVAAAKLWQMLVRRPEEYYRE
jgi:hypothetical protein